MTQPSDRIDSPSEEISKIPWQGLEPPVDASPESAERSLGAPSLVVPESA
jgi:hypothetical protein